MNNNDKACIFISLVFVFPMMLFLTALFFDVNIIQAIKEPKLLFKPVCTSITITALMTILPLLCAHVETWFKKIYKENTEFIQTGLKFNSIVFETLFKIIIVGSFILILSYGFIIEPLCKKFNWGNDNPKSIFRKPDLMYQGYVYAFPCPDFECTSKNYKVVADIQHGDIQKIYFKNGGYLEIDNCDGNGLGGDDYYCEEAKTGEIWGFEYYGELVKNKNKQKPLLIK